MMLILTRLGRHDKDKAPEFVFDKVGDQILAFAHQIQKALDWGDVKDRAAAARNLGMTRARLTQLLDPTEAYSVSP
jgi:hypothetical protein